MHAPARQDERIHSTQTQRSPVDLCHKSEQEGTHESPREPIAHPFREPPAGPGQRHLALGSQAQDGALGRAER